MYIIYVLLRYESYLFTLYNLAMDKLLWYITAVVL